jgi:hypothetical protein
MLISGILATSCALPCGQPRPLSYRTGPSCPGRRAGGRSLPGAPTFADALITWCVGRVKLRARAHG